MDYTRCARISTNIIHRTQDPNGRGLDARRYLLLQNGAI